MEKPKQKLIDSLVWGMLVPLTVSLKTLKHTVLNVDMDIACEEKGRLGVSGKRGDGIHIQLMKRIHT